MRKLFLTFSFSVWWSLSIGQVRIGILSDLPRSETVDNYVAALLQEIDKTTGVNRRVTSPESAQYYGISSGTQARETYAQLKVDLVLCIGGVSNQALGKLPSLHIPVIGVGIVDPDLQEIPYVNGRSGRENYTYLLTSRDIISEITSFQKIIPFQTLTVVNDVAFSQSISPDKGLQLLDSLQSSLDISIERVEAAADVRQTIENIGSPDAVYLASLFGRSAAYIQALTEHCNQQGIPVFSSAKSHVDLGALASTSGDNSLQQVVRRVAIVAADILSGQRAANNLVALNLSEAIFINASTARQLNLAISFDLLLTVNIVGDPQKEGNAYSFNEIAEQALKKNFNIQISYRDIDLSELDIRSNRANYLPSINSGLTAVQINEERANALLNSSEQTLNMDLVLTQVVYSEEALAAIRISRYLRNAQIHQTDVDILNVMLDTYSAYLNVLSAKTNLDIQRTNLENTKTNLELAKFRVLLGSANNADLYRWESEVANATQLVIEAQATLLQVQLQLNNLLANTLEPDFRVQDIGLEDKLFQDFRNSPLSGLISNPNDLRRAADFLVRESLARNPNKQQLLENIKATERQLSLTKRLFYVPTVAVQAQTSYVLARSGEGSTEPNTGMPSFGNGLQDNAWAVTANLSYPIFTGLNRQVNKKRAEVQLQQLNVSSQNLDQALELGIRTGTINLLAATTNLEYSKISAQSASQNFLLVQSNYKEGMVNITQLIDAQEAALGADLQAALAAYEYILANLQLEYSIGQFSMFMTQEEVNEFNRRFLQFISEN